MFVLELTLVLAAIFVFAAMFAFRWAVKDGQLDDLDTPAMRILGDAPRKNVGNPAPTESADAPRKQGATPAPDAGDR